MPAGTIALTNGSKTVTGTGTSFTTELKAGDFVYVTVGGAPYTLVASAVTSNTQLTLAVAFDGPTTTGLAWNAVPASLQVAITQKILNDFAQVARGRILDFQNWQKIYSTDQSITVTRPDRSTFTGPSWGYMAAQYANKVDKTALDSYLLKSDNLGSLTDKAVARTNLGFVDGVLPITLGGTGAKTKAAAWTALATYGNTAGTAAQGNDSRLDTINNKSGGNVNGAVNARAVSNVGTQGLALSSSIENTSGGVHTKISIFPELTSTGGRYAHFLINQDNNFKDWFFDYTQGNAYAPNAWVNQSDKRIKENIEVVTEPLLKMRKLRGCTWIRTDEQVKGNFGIGFIAQEVQEVFPDAVSSGPTGSIKVEGKSIENPLALSAGDVAAALHHEAILALMDKLDKKDAVIAELQKRMKAIDGLDA